MTIVDSYAVAVAMCTCQPASANRIIVPAQRNSASSGWANSTTAPSATNAAAISGYLGSGDGFDRAVAGFAEAYADQTEADYAAFTRSLDGWPSRDRGRGGGTNQRKGDGG